MLDYLSVCLSVCVFIFCLNQRQDEGGSLSARLSILCLVERKGVVVYAVEDTKV